MAEGDGRAEHLASCKARALEYVDQGDLADAAASMLSDMSKHPLTEIGNAVQSLHANLAIRCVLDYDEAGLRRWINGFN